VRFLGEPGETERQMMRHHLREAVPVNAAQRVWSELAGLSAGPGPLAAGASA